MSMTSVSLTSENRVNEKDQNFRGVFLATRENGAHAEIWKTQLNIHTTICYIRNALHFASKLPAGSGFCLKNIGFNFLSI